MPFKYLLVFVLLIQVCNHHAIAQGLSLRTLQNEYEVLDRLQIKNRSFATVFNSTVKNVNSKDAYQYIFNNSNVSLSAVDQYNLSRIASNWHDWNDEMQVGLRQHGPLKWAYAHPSNFYEKHEQGNFNNNSGTKFINTRGFDIRAHLNAKLYLYTQVTENQERQSSWGQAYSATMNQVPGGAFIKSFNKPGMSGGYDYLLAKGYLGYEVLKDKLNITFGHDKFFIGDGYRSLFLSDFGTNMLFASMDLKFWKLHYKTIITELTPAFYTTNDGLRAKKYGAFHHATFNFTPGFSAGVFEGVMLNRSKHFELQYLNPVIFYRTVEQYLGSPDNALAGLDFRAIPFARTQLYGQLLLDEFVAAAMRGNTKDWRNKYAVQLGLKHIDVAGVKNLDAHVEYNYIRPFTYSYQDSVNDYSHYKQPLAHPNGANLSEWIFALKYQPIKKLHLSTEVIYRTQGLDTSATYSNGGNIFKSYSQRPADVGFTMHNGNAVSTLYFNVNACYEAWQNLFVDAGISVNNMKSINNSTVSNNAQLFYLGVRLNTDRRKYNY
jgi:hypothetical protein